MFFLLGDGTLRHRTGGRAADILQPIREAVVERVLSPNERVGCCAAVGRLLREAVAVGSRRQQGDRIGKYLTLNK